MFTPIEKRLAAKADALASAIKMSSLAFIVHDLPGAVNCIHAAKPYPQAVQLVTDLSGQEPVVDIHQKGRSSPAVFTPARRSRGPSFSDTDGCARGCLVDLFADRGQVQLALFPGADVLALGGPGFVFDRHSRQNCKSLKPCRPCGTRFPMMRASPALACRAFTCRRSGLQRCWLTFFRPLRGLLQTLDCSPRLAPWAAFFRRFG